MRRALAQVPRKLVFAAAIAFPCSSSGCSSAPPLAPPQGQVLLHVDTDAPVPHADGRAPTFDTPLPLFDHVRFDVLPPASDTPCAGCSNDFAIDHESLQAGNVSIGIPLPTGTAGYRVRIRLYLARLVPVGGEPAASASLETTVTLPALAPDGIVELTADLSTSDVGAPSTPNVRSGAPGESRVGSWSGAQRRPCNGATPAGTACVPGGAIWLGAHGDDAGVGGAVGWHRLAVVSPFFIDVHETTVAEARALLPAATASTLRRWNGSTTGASFDDWCTFSMTPTARDGLPLNCVNADVAAEICGLRGLSLPTESQQEYVMGGLMMRSFAWGEEPPTCVDAVVDRRATGGLFATDQNLCDVAVKELGGLNGPELAGQGARDRLELPGGTVLDLAGNLAEISSDGWQERNGECWRATTLLTDPVCADTSLGNAAHGGQWNIGGLWGAAPSRANLPRGAGVVSDSNQVGFRCVKSAK